MTACFGMFFFCSFSWLKRHDYGIRKKIGIYESLMLKPGTSRAVIVTGYLADGLPFKYFWDYDLSGSKWTPNHFFTFTLGHFRVRYRRFTVESALFFVGSRIRGMGSRYLS